MDVSPLPAAPHLTAANGDGERMATSVCRAPVRPESAPSLRRHGDVKALGARVCAGRSGGGDGDGDGDCDGANTLSSYGTAQRNAAAQRIVTAAAGSAGMVTVKSRVNALIMARPLFLAAAEAPSAKAASA